MAVAVKKNTQIWQVLSKSGYAKIRYNKYIA